MGAIETVVVVVILTGLASLVVVARYLDKQGTPTTGYSGQPSRVGVSSKWLLW